MNTRAELALVGTVALVAAGAVLGLIGREQAKLRMELSRCGNYMKSIGFAARMWANENGDRLPATLLSMSNEVIVTKILICPGDHSRKPAASWASFTPEQSSFEIVSPGLPDGDTNRVFLRCRIHDSVCYGDGSVFVNGRPHKKL